MKEKNTIFSFVIAGLFLFTISCDGPSPSSSITPAEVNQEILEETDKGNFDVVMDLFSTGGKGFTNEEKEQLIEVLQLAQEEVQKKGGYKSFEILEEGISPSGDEATVKLKVIHGNGKEEFTTNKFVLEDGRWKLKMK